MSANLEQICEELLFGDPITPQHEKPESLEASGFTMFVGDSDRRFFADFEHFADEVNYNYMPDEGWAGGPWRLQELNSSVLKLVEVDDTPILGRRYQLFRNRVQVGLIEVSPSISPGYGEIPSVTAYVEMRYARFMPFDDVFVFLSSLARLVCSEDEQRERARDEIQRCMLAAVWRTDPHGREFDVGIDARFDGSAEHYLRRLEHRIREARP